ncbi:MAG: 1-deoxy-D-xylulose-5-phosphate synthase, partial [Actinomycetota bacterium]
ERPDVVAITAAMMGPTGLSEFAAMFPDRTFDVGIAEQQAATAAAGMALAGLHPIVALYATFINRAFDQVLMDCALHKAGVTFVLDRAGVTGDDGASHNGIWDLALMSIVPGVQIFAPRDVDTLQAALKRAVTVNDGPSIVRFSKGNVPPQISAVRRINDIDVLVDNDVCEVFLVGIGALAELTVEIANSLNAIGIASIVVNPTRVFPIAQDFTDFAIKAKLVVTIEDGLARGGFGDALSAYLRDKNIFVPVKTFGVTDGFPRHAPRSKILEESGLDCESIVESIKTSLAKRWIFAD